MLLLTSYRSKTETKEAVFKSITLAPGVVISKPEASGAKPAGLFGAAEPDGFIITVTSEHNAPTLDLKVKRKQLFFVHLFFIILTNEY